MRVVVGQVIKLIQRYPPLVDGAFVIIAWVGTKLLLDYAYRLSWISWEVPQTLSLGLIFVIIGAAYVYARLRGPQPEHKAEAELIEDDRV